MANLDGATFTRSIYIGRDRTSEVLKRKEAVEKELMARREAKIRENEERIARVKHKKEDELRERIRQRQQRELERQKAVLDRRCAQLEKLNAKKEEILHRNHQKSSRTATNQQNKPVYAFGSSTPRHLEFNYNGEQRTAKLDSSRGSTPVLTQTAPPTTSRFRTGQQIQVPSSMTRSVFGSLNSNATTGSSQKQPTPKKMKPPTLKKPAQQETRAKTANTTSPMTQSLYMPKRKILVTKENEKPVATKSTREQIGNKLKTPAKQEQITPKLMNETVQQQRPPPIRPRKMQQKQQVQDVIPDIVEKKSNSDLPTSSNSDLTTKIQQQLQPVITDTVETKPNSDLITTSTADFSIFPNDNPQNDDLPLYQNEIEKNDVVTGELAQQQNFNHENGESTESVMHPLDVTEATIIADKSSDEDVTLTFDSPHDNHKDSSLEICEVNVEKIAVVTEQQQPIRSSTSGSGIVLPPEQDELRENRRQRLNEILQRTRKEGNAPITAGTAGLASNGGGEVNLFPTNATAFANPLITNIDKAALAKELLAQRRQQKLQQEMEGEETKQRPLTFTNELAQSGFFIGNSSNTAQYYKLPGEIISPRQEQQPVLPPQKISTMTEMAEDEAVKEIAKNDNGNVLIAPSLRTPPDDPYMNGHRNKDQEDHPPEPTIIEF